MTEQGRSRPALHHIGLSVRDLDASVDFYCRHFGMTSGPVVPFGGQAISNVMGVENASGRMTMVESPSLRLELFEFHNPIPEDRSARRPVSEFGYSHFCLEVDDVDAVYDRLAQDGVAFHHPVTGFGEKTRATYGRDLDGNVFEIVQFQRAD